MELGGRPEKLFLLWVIAAEIAYQRNPDAFGNVEDLGGHKSRVAESRGEARRATEARFPSTWVHGDLHIGTDHERRRGADHTFPKLAPGEVPVHPPETAGERLVEYLLRQEHETEAQAA